MLSFLRATKKLQASSGRQSIFQPAESDIFAKVTHLSFQEEVAKFAARKKLKYNPQFATCYVQCNWKRKNCFKLIGWYRKRASSGPASDDSSLDALKNAKNGREKSGGLPINISRGCFSFAWHITFSWIPVGGLESETTHTILLWSAGGSWVVFLKQHARVSRGKEKLLYIKQWLLMKLVEL